VAGFEYVAGQRFQALSEFSTACIGDGKSILFWRDSWINGHTTEEIAPAVTAVVTMQRKNCR
jgi:hypothetical protein